MPEISVIVPVFKAENYINRCVDSILSQTFQDFEIVLVDDGSPDKSGAICDAYAKTDSRIKVIHKTNDGVSSARNAGIEVAKGQWVTFVDSDDYITPNYLADLYEPTFDVVVSGHKVISSSGEEYYLKHIKRQYDHINADVIKTLMETDGNTWLYLMTAHLLKLSILNENSIRFHTEYHFREDSLFMAEYVANCSSICVKESCNYVYMRRDSGSLSTTYDIPFFNALYETDKKISSIISECFNMDFSKFSDAEVSHIMSGSLGEIAVDKSFSLFKKYAIFKYLFSNRHFLLAIEDMNEYFPDTSALYRRVLKMKSPFIMLTLLTVRTKLRCII